MAGAQAAGSLTATNGILADSYGQADTGRPDEHLARSHGGLRAGHRSRSPRATENRDQGLLRLLDALRRSNEFEYMPRLSGLARRIADAEQASGRAGHPRGAGPASKCPGILPLRPKKLFLSRPAQRLPDFHV